MPFVNQANFNHQQHDKIGVLITNLGTPAAPTAKALRRYLKQFLSDPRVVEVPRLLWWLILNGVILNIRPARSARAYRGVWTDAGSPLMTHTQDQAKALSAALLERYGEDIAVRFAMRYGDPSISKGIQDLVDTGARKLLVVPLYPQYSASTTASTFDAVAADFCRRRHLPELRFVNHYHDREDYIAALAHTVERHWHTHGRADKLIMSYHGIPRKYLDQGDPYFCECHKTSRLLAEALELPASDYITVFQSRFGREEWLQPYCDKTLQTLASQGVKSVQLICPGFSADCLETIEEIGIENRDYFLNAGGQRYEYIAALNSEAEHISMLAQLVSDNIQGWQIKRDTQRHDRAAAQGANT